MKPAAVTERAGQHPTLLELLHDHLDASDRVVDQQPQGDDQGAEGDALEGETHHRWR